MQNEDVWTMHHMPMRGHLLRYFCVLSFTKIMAGVRNIINELKLQQENLQSQIEDVEVEIKNAEEENYKETLLQQKIKKTTEQEKAKLDKILKLEAQYSGVNESSESLTAKSKDANEKQEKLLDELKEAREQANKNDMMYEELKKRLVHMERNRDRMEQRAALKEAEAKRLEEGFKAANSQVEVLRSKDFENDTDLMDKVSDLQKKLDEAIRTAETSERVGAAFGQSIENLKQQISKQREENEKIKKEMEKMNEVLEISET
ncbi:Laminin subunit gamma-1 [Taenia crassiceps]|uniref:Laminin subunit gamma-1 n=1 Tax=Taenia crassiceps TaxID=6207 RepID=A0ABR4QQD8_9CEST